MRPLNNYGRIAVHLTEETFFAVKDYCTKLGRSDYGTARAKTIRELVKLGLPKLDLKKVAYGIQLKRGTAFKRMTLILPLRQIDEIRYQARQGYSVNWVVEKILRLGLREAEVERMAVHG